MTPAGNDRQVAVLFARRDSIYKTMPECDVYDTERNALTYPGGLPVIAHPPCRAWGRLRTFANPHPGEKELALWAVAQVQRWGGVLEHPAGSTLWDAADLPSIGRTDEHGGITLPVLQYWWGHRAEKPTWLYVVGCPRPLMPLIPLKMGEASHVVQSRKSTRDGGRPHIPKAEREHTPVELARWLVELAIKCTKEERTVPRPTHRQMLLSL
jgi:hypothetical protein